MTNFKYIRFIFDYPLYRYVNSMLAAFGLILCFIVKNRDYVKKIVYLWSLIGFTLIFFVFIADRYPSSRYVAHVIPVVIILIVWVANTIFSSIYSKKISFFVMLILVICIFTNFNERFDHLYIRNTDFGEPSAALQTVVNSQKEPDQMVIIARRLRTYYMQGLDPDIELIRMLNYEPEEQKYEYDYEMFLSDIDRSRGKDIWVIWEKHKAKHIHPEIQNYLEQNAEKIHGEGVDDTRMEIFLLKQK
ncbi:hypothetical protein GF357_00580 [Candidatus Dojkabacteria bacterium]|nr:hypothetical protein [Candidatus Dojkabacteria bacterium]